MHSATRSPNNGRSDGALFFEKLKNAWRQPLHNAILSRCGGGTNIETPGIAGPASERRSLRFQHRPGHCVEMTKRVSEVEGSAYVDEMGIRERFDECWRQPDVSSVEAIH